MTTKSKKPAKKASGPRKLNIREAKDILQDYLMNLVSSKTWVIEKVLERAKYFSGTFRGERFLIYIIRSQVVDVRIGEARFSSECSELRAISLVLWAQDRIRDQEERAKMAFMLSPDGRYTFRHQDALLRVAGRLAKRTR